MTSNEILQKLTIKQKIDLLSGKDFWHTMDIPELGVPSIEVSDGPCGLRKQKKKFDHLGFHESEQATACVSGPALAAGFDKDLFEQAGRLLGEECRAYGVDLLLGPSVNIQKSPLCGRNFEYFSEDPVLAGKAAAGFIQGVQSTGTGACIKHFAANNQETEREYVDARIEERTLREIYLKVFEIAIREAEPWAVMTALNKVNGSYASENSFLLEEILRREWGYEGFVMSDWWGINDRVRALSAGLDLEMPYSMGVGAKKLKKALEDGSIQEPELDRSCERILRCALSLKKSEDEEGNFDRRAHHELAREQAAKTIVLLKNKDLLPLSTECSVAVIGDMAVKPRYRLEGSALVNPTMEDIPLEEIQRLCTASVRYEAGLGSGEALQKALDAAANADAAVIFAGLTQGMESEGHDRKHLFLPEEQNRLIAAVAAVQPRTVVVLANGGPVVMPWLAAVSGVFECFLAGQAMGGAVAELLFGKRTPEGKLPVTFPAELAQVPDSLEWPGNLEWQDYKEGVFTGYRYYDRKRIEPLFPFGFGLSYTTFSYGPLEADLSGLLTGKKARFTILIKNTGRRTGAEAVQLYTGAPSGVFQRPEKELKDFCKLTLAPGEEKEAVFELDWTAFSMFHPELRDWYVDSGVYRVMAGSSSRDIRSCVSVSIKQETVLPPKLTGWSGVERLRETETGKSALAEMKDIIQTSFCEDGLRQMFEDEDFGDLKIRFLTLQSQTVLDNDRIEYYLRQCNEEMIQKYRRHRGQGSPAFTECEVF